MAHYRLHTASGKQYVWEGNLDEIRWRITEHGHGVDLLECPGGTVVNLSHVEAFEPID